MTSMIKKHANHSHLLYRSQMLSQPTEARCSRNPQQQRHDRKQNPKRAAKKTTEPTSNMLLSHHTEHSPEGTIRKEPFISFIDRIKSSTNFSRMQRMRVENRHECRQTCYSSTVARKQNSSEQPIPRWSRGLQGT